MKEEEDIDVESLTEEEVMEHLRMLPSDQFWKAFWAIITRDD
jgi:hypothetical protein